MEYKRDRTYNFSSGGNSNTPGMLDGYLSDVPTNQSLSPSEVSHDFIQSQRVLERNFKDKYRLLKSTYEKRLKHLSETVAESCQAMMNDEVLIEMRLDKTSSAFIPAHLSELVDRHLENSREKYLHQMVSKVTQLEGELQKSKESTAIQQQKMSKMEAELIRGRRAEMLIEPMQTKILSLEKEYQLLSKQSSEEIEALKFTISDIDRSREIVAQKLDKALRDLVVTTKECDQLHSTLDNQNKHVTKLEESYEQSARDIKVIAEVERQDRQFKQELKDQVNRLVEERNRLVHENADWKSRASIAENELGRMQTLRQVQGEEQVKSEQKFSSLMRQVEAMLAQEANESNAAISTVHDKMKQLKHKLTMEVQREKRNAQALQDELFSMKSMKDGQAMELVRMTQERDDFKERLNIETEKAARLSLRVQETNNIELDCKSKVKESEFKMRQAEQKLLEFQNLKNQEMKIIESRIQLEVEKSFESERFHLDTRSTAHRLKYQNELEALQSNIRNSINGDSLGGVEQNGFQQQMHNQSTLHQNYPNRSYSYHPANNELNRSFGDFAPDQTLKFGGGNNNNNKTTTTTATATTTAGTSIGLIMRLSMKRILRWFDRSLRINMKT